MTNGAFKIWETVLVVVGVALAVVFAFLDNLTDLNIPRVFLGVDIMIAVSALFARPVWLLANWRYMDEKETLATVEEVYHHKIPRSYLRVSALTYGRKKKRKTVTVAQVMFFYPKIGEKYRLLLNSRRPKEFLILPAAKINAAVFAVLGIAAEIFLALGIGKL